MKKTIILLFISFISLTSNGQACLYFTLKYIGVIESKSLKANKIALPSLKYLLRKKEVDEELFYELLDNKINIESVTKSAFMPNSLCDFLNSKQEYISIAVIATNENGEEVKKKIKINLNKIKFRQTEYTTVLDIGLIRI